MKAFLKSRANIIFIVACTAIIFCNSLNNGFVWDDNILLVPNDAYQKLDFQKIFFTKVNSLEYLPFRDLTYAIDFQIWGMKPFGFHLTNLLLYLASLFALFKIVKDIALIAGEKECEFIAFWTTLIFAVHPLHAEVVNFIHGRNSILAALFLFVSFALCLEGIKQQKNSLLFMSALIFIMAVFSKAIIIFFPIFLAIILYLIPEATASRQKKLAVLLIFLLIDVFAIGIHFKNASSTKIININSLAYGTDSWGIMFIKALQIPFFYLKMLVFPYPLTVAYGVSFVSGQFIIYSVLAGIAVLGIMYIVLTLWKRYLLPVLGILWYFLSLTPVLNIFPTVPSVADRYAFLSVFGFGLVLAYFLKIASKKSRFFIYAACVVVVVWGLIDIARNMDWRSDLSLWESALSANPDMDRENLANALWSEGQYEKALALLKEERERTDSYHYNLYLGKYFFKSGKYSDAIASYKDALLEGGDSRKESHVYLAQAYEKAGFESLAFEQYIKATETESLDPLGRYNEIAIDGINRIRARLMPELEKARSQALKEPLNFQAQSSFALSLHKIGLYKEAEEFYLKSVEINPSSWEVWYNLGLTYMKRHIYEDAIKSFEESLRLNPKNKDALNNIGICYMTMQNYLQAVKFYERALALDPEFFYAAFNLGRVYFITGNRDMCKKYFFLAKTLANGNSEKLARVNQHLRQIK